MKSPYKKDLAQGDVHHDAINSQISVAYIQDQSQYISTKVFPIVHVDKQSDKYWTMPKESWLRDEAQKRADSTESVGSGWEVSKDSYFAEVWAFHKDLGYQLRANADAAMRLEENATKFVTQRLLMRQEIQWVTDFFTTGIWGTDATPSVLWDDYTGSDPIEDIESAKEAISSVTGFEPNTFVLGKQAWRRLRNHPDIRDRIGGLTGNGGKQVTLQQFAQLIEVDKIYINRAIKATNKKGSTPATYSYIFGKHALLCYVPDAPGLDVPSAGYTFSWDGVSGGAGTDVNIDTFDIRTTKARRVEGEMAWDNKVVAADLGYFFNSVVS